MLHRGDDRAVTVQIGAVLLLAILFAALTLYQLNAVPAANHEVEFNHNEELKTDLISLQSAIDNIDSAGSSQRVPITLGTQYESRTVAVNPPQPRGTIQSEQPSYDVQIEVGDESDTFETRFIAYEPGYNEYTNAPNTVYEHGLLYDQFDDASVTLEEPSLFNGDRFVMPILTGNLERTDTGAVSVSVDHMDGPRTKDVSGETVSITLPTSAADRWTDSLEEYDIEPGEDGETVTLETDELDEITLIGVGIGDDADEEPLNGFGSPTNKNGGTSSPDGSGTYDVFWADEHENARQCDADACDYEIYAEETATFVAGASAEAATLDFAYSSQGPTLTRFQELNDQVEVRAEGSGDVYLYVSSGGSSEMLTISVVHDELPPSIDLFEVESEDHQNHARFDIDWSATMGDNGISEAELQLINDGTVVDSWANEYDDVDEVTEEGIDLEEQQEAGTEYEVRLTVFDSNENSRTESRTVTG